MNLTETLHAAKEEIVNLTYEELASSQSLDPLQSSSTLKKRLDLQMSDLLEKYTEQMQRGYRQLQNAYAKAKTDDPSLRLDFLEPEFYREKEIEFMTFLIQGEKESLVKVLGIDSRQLSSAHNMLKPLFDEYRFEEASDALFWLVNIAPSVPQLLSSLAQAKYFSNKKEEAANCYSLAYMCDTSDKEPLLHAIHCLIELGLKEEATTYLSQLDAMAANEHNDELAKLAQAIRIEINNIKNGR